MLEANGQWRTTSKTPIW
jgi:hypothetical protein